MLIFKDIDVFSLGLIFLEINSIFNSLLEDEQSKKEYELFKRLYNEINSLIEKMLKPILTKRIASSDLATNYNYLISDL